MKTIMVSILTIVPKITGMTLLNILYILQNAWLCGLNFYLFLGGGWGGGMTKCSLVNIWLFFCFILLRKKYLFIYFFLHLTKACLPFLERHPNYTAGKSNFLCIPDILTRKYVTCRRHILGKQGYQETYVCTSPFCLWSLSEIKLICKEMPYCFLAFSVYISGQLMSVVYHS